MMLETVLCIMIVLVLLPGVYQGVRWACHRWGCGAIKRNWKKREPNSNDYDLHTTSKLSEYDRFLTDHNDWRLSGEKEVRENGPDDC